MPPITWPHERYSICANDNLTSKPYALELNRSQFTSASFPSSLRQVVKEIFDFGALMPSAIELIVEGYARLKDRESLEHLRMHRQRLAVDLKARAGFDCR